MATGQDKTMRTCLNKSEFFTRLSILLVITRCYSSDVLKTSFRVISGCGKNYKRTMPVLTSYYSVSRISCTINCAVTFMCSGINYCHTPSSSNCDLLSDLSGPLSCGDLQYEEGCIYLHKGPCFNGGIYQSGDDTCVCTYNFAGAYCHRYFEDCVEAHVLGFRLSALTIVQPSTDLPPFEVKCRLTGEPMARIVKRNIAGTDFFPGQKWNNFKYGFGLPAKNNMWLGLEKIHKLLKVAGRRYTAKIAVTFIGDNFSYNGFLDDFQIASEADDYKLSFSAFHTEGMRSLPDAFAQNGTIDAINGCPFCTLDRDCEESAKNSNSGWWFGARCVGVNINLPATEMIWPNGSYNISVEKITIDILPSK